MPRKTKGGSPLVLTKETYKTFRDGCAGSKTVVVLHHMEGCPYCTMIRPAWTDAVRRAGPSAAAAVAEIQYDPMWTPTEMADVRGFPTIRAYSNGRAIAEYQGDRTAESILGFIAAQTAATAASASAKPAAAKSKPKPAAKKSPPAKKSASAAKKRSTAA